MEEAKILTEPMTREHLDRVKAGGPASPEKGPPVDPKTGSVIDQSAPPLGPHSGPLELNLMDRPVFDLDDPKKSQVEEDTDYLKGVVGDTSYSLATGGPLRTYPKIT